MRKTVSQTWNGCLRILLLLVSLATIELGFSSFTYAQPRPRIAKGMIDLQNWNFAQMGPVPLDGHWQFYWQQFIPPGKGAAGPPVTAVDHLKVPYVWNDHPVDGRPLSGFGYASYRLLIRLAPDPQPLALHLIDAATAFTVYANGEQVFQAGQPGKTRDTSRPSFRPSVITLPARGGDLELLFHVSNYHHRQGGLWDRITLGDPDQLQEVREKRIAYNMILFGSLLLAGIYHLGLFVLRRNILSPLYFGLGCLAILLRTFTTGERYIVQLYPDFPFELLSKLEYLGFYLAIGCFALFVQSLFPRETDRSTIKFLAGTAIGFSMLVLLTPLRFYSYTTPAYEMVTILALVYGFFILGRALRNKRQGAGIFLAGFIILSATAVNDILYSRQFIHSAYIVQFGMIAFILAQTFLLASRFSRSFDTVAAQKIQLRRSEEKYRQLVDHAGDGIFILENKTFRFINPRTEELTGLKMAEMQPLSFTSLIHPDDRIRVREHLEKGAGIMTGVTTCAFRLERRPGETIWVELNTVPTTWEDKPATLNFMRNINRQKKLEDQLSQAQKMEALGTLSSGIALNFNNILGSIIGNTELILDKLPPDDSRRLYLDQVMDASLKARQMVEQILIFSRKGQHEQSPVDITAVIEGAVQFLRASIPPNIRIHAHIMTRKNIVMANATQLSQLLLNLATNSAQAMQTSGGNIHISMNLLTVKDKQPAEETELAPGDFVRLTIADNGSGIPVEIQPKIFDPYFTTKAPDQGTGMGLSVAMGIVNAHGGHIDLISTPGLGTTFHIYLPVMPAREKAVLPKPEVRSPVGWERILVVDDDERILKVLVEMLGELGYAVEPFNTAEVALDHLHKSSRPYDLVITDLEMPGMAGIEFARRVKDLRSNLPILLCTGFLEPADGKHADIITAVIKKPFYREDLARIVRNALDEKVSNRF